MTSVMGNDIHSTQQSTPTETEDPHSHVVFPPVGIGYPCEAVHFDFMEDGSLFAAPPHCSIEGTFIGQDGDHVDVTLTFHDDSGACFAAVTVHCDPDHVCERVVTMAASYYFATLPTLRGKAYSAEERAALIDQYEKSPEQKTATERRRAMHRTRLANIATDDTLNKKIEAVFDAPAGRVARAGIELFAAFMSKGMTTAQVEYFKPTLDEMNDYQYLMTDFVLSDNGPFWAWSREAAVAVGLRDDQFLYLVVNPVWAHWFGQKLLPAEAAKAFAKSRSGRGPASAVSSGA